MLSKVVFNTLKRMTREKKRRPGVPKAVSHSKVLEATALDGTHISGWYKEGKGGTVLLTNGITRNCVIDGLPERANALHKRYGLSIAGIDFRLHGASGDGMTSFGSAESWDLRCAMDELENKGLEGPFFLIGISLGAMASLVTAVDDERVKGAILISQPAWPWDAVGVTVRLNMDKFKLGGLARPGVRLAGNSINKVYRDYRHEFKRASSILSSGDARRCEKSPGHRPRLLWIMGNKDHFGIDKTRKVFNHFYPGERAHFGVSPSESPDSMSWFVKAKGHHHPGGRGGRRHHNHTVDWPEMDSTIFKFMDIVLKENSGGKCSSPRIEKAGKGHKRELVWFDDFEYTGKPDESKWTFDVRGDGCGNNEYQYYTGGDNAWVADGRLIIEARKEAYSGKNFTSARLTTKHKGDWKYGRVEVRAKLPKGRGTWPAIWMLPTVDKLKWPRDGEIDIMEHVGYERGIIHGTVHTKSYNHMKGTQRGAKVKVPHVSSHFHVYAIEWTSSSIRWFVDGEEYFRFKKGKDGNSVWPFDKPFHLILNIAVGGDWGGKHGIDMDIWPQRMVIDYVKVWQ